MSNIKCPICQHNLHKINIVVSTCTNDKCKLWGSSIPNLVLGALAQAKQDLERKRKVLETLQEFITKLYLNGNISDEQLERYKKTLITALKKKEVK